LSLTVLDDGTVSIDGATGAITIEILEPAEFAGTYTQDVDGRPLTTDLVTADRFVCILRPVISGMAAVGEELVALHDGLWIYIGAEPTFSYQWLSDGAPIEGETEATIVLASPQAGTNVALAVVAQEGSDTVTAASLSVSVAAGYVFTDNFDTYADGENISASAGWDDPDSWNRAQPFSYTYDAASDTARLDRPLSSNFAMIGVLHSPALENDQYAEIAFGAFENTAVNRWIGPCIRANGSFDTLYFVNYNPFNDDVSLVKRVSGANSNLGTWNNGGLGANIGSGDLIRLEAEGTTLRAMIDRGSGWETVITTTDSDIASGKAGWVSYLGDASAVGWRSISSFGCGEVI
jgi:hypothetical protein